MQNPASDLLLEKNPEAAANGLDEMVEKDDTFLTKGAILISDDDSDDSESSLPLSPSASAFTIELRGDDDATGTSKGPKRKAEAAGAGSSNGVKRQYHDWKEEEEVAVLEGIIEYMSTKQAQPLGRKFHAYLKSNVNLTFEASRSQMSDKIYTLRKTYEANIEKLAKNDENHVFKKAHKKNVFELSKQIWGPEAELLHGFRVELRKPRNSKAKAETSKTSKKKGKKIEAQPNSGVDKGKGKATELGAAGNLNFRPKLPLNSEKGEDFCDVKKVIMERMSSGNYDIPNELEKKWKDLQEEEIKVKLIKIEFDQKLHEFALDLFRSSRARRQRSNGFIAEKS